MTTLALLTLLLIMSGSAVGQMLKSNLTGFVGKDVLLSFNCSNDTKELVWQKGDRVVNIYPQNKSIIDDNYVDRTQLFINKEKRNCSLLLRNISTADAGLYTCHVLINIHDHVLSRSSSEVYLTVSTYVPTAGTVSDSLGVPTTLLPEADQGVHRLHICSVK